MSEAPAVAAPVSAPTAQVDASHQSPPTTAKSEVVEKADASLETKVAPTPETLKKKFKLKVDGEEIEEEIDFNDEAGIVQRLQLAKAAKKRMAEAVNARKQAMEIVKAFEKDPESMLERLGDKGREIAEKYLMKHIQESMMSPEEKRLKELEKKVETYEQREAREKQEREAEAIAKKESEYANSFQQTIISALQKSGLPKTPQIVKRMAAIMQRNLEFGLELTPDDLVTEVKQELTELFQAISKDSDADHLLNILGKDAANKIRKHDLKSLQEKQAQVFQSPKVSKSSNPKPDKGYTTIDEWKEQINKRIKESP